MKMQIVELLPRRVKSIKKCGGCRKTMKNKYNSISYLKKIKKVDKKSGSVTMWLGVDRECTRCGTMNEAI